MVLRGASVHAQPASPQLSLAHLAAVGGSAAVLRLMLPRLPQAALSDQSNPQRAAQCSGAARCGLL